MTDHPDTPRLGTPRSALLDRIAPITTLSIGLENDKEWTVRTAFGEDLQKIEDAAREPLLALLRRLEFVQPMSNANPECVICGGRRHWAADREGAPGSEIDERGHVKGCSLAKAIA